MTIINKYGLPVDISETDFITILKYKNNRGFEYGK